MNGDRWEFKNLGRQGEANRTPGMWPNGESETLRARYDAILRANAIRWVPVIDMATTKVCQACSGSGRRNGKQCSACHGSGSLPAAK